MTNNTSTSVLNSWQLHKPKEIYSENYLNLIATHQAISQTDRSNPALQLNESSTKGNFAFLDMQNLYKGIQERGWKIDWKPFRQYLQDKFNVT